VQREVTTDDGCRRSVESSHRGVAEKEWKDWAKRRAYGRTLHSAVRIARRLEK
jgi:hypothetical protein